VNLTDLSACCRHCGWAFGRGGTPFRQAAITTPVTHEVALSKRRPGLPRPPRIRLDVDESSGATELSFLPYHLVDTENAIKAVALGVAGMMMGSAVWFVRSPVGGVLIAVCVVVLLFGILGLVGKAYLRIGIRDLVVRSSGWSLPRYLPIRDLDQLYVDEALPHPTRPYSLYTLKARRTDGSDTVLVANLKSPVVALFIEQELERQLGIQDEPVSGEYERQPPDA
jgi:hypothetical protein